MLGIVSGVQQGGSVGEAAAIGNGLHVLVCVMAAIVVLPVCLVLWSVRWMVRRSARQKTRDELQKTVQIGEHSIEFEHRRFPLRPNRFLSVFLLLLATGGEAMFCYMAVELDSVLFLVMAVLGPIGIVGIGVSVFRAFFGKECVVLTESEIILPKVNRLGFYTGAICVAFRDITEVRIGPNGVCVRHTQGRFCLNNFMFPTRRDYDSVTSLLATSFKLWFGESAVPQQTPKPSGPGR